jgi:D-alanyl-D-alanine carboxypeptidase
MHRHIKLFAALFTLTVVLLSGHVAHARHAVLVYDVASGRVLHEENGYEKRYPASLTKMMTLYLLFEQLRDGRMSMQTPMHVSARAAAQPQTNISLRKGTTITVEQAIKALVIRSANDVAVVVAENVSGSVEKFARLATQKSKQLGMTNTHFRNPHGLPDYHQYTTAKDMAMLGVALRRDFPQYYHYFSTQQFSHNGVRYTSHNRVLKRMRGVDGIKTGFIRASGFNVVSSFKHDGFNVVAVVMGGNSAAERDNRMVALLQKTHVKLAAERSGSAQEFPVAYAPIPVFKPVLNAALTVAGATSIAASNPPSKESLRSVANAMMAPAKKPTNPQYAILERAAKPAISVSFNPTATVARENSVSVNFQTTAASSAPVKARNGTLDYQLATLGRSTYPVPTKLTGSAVASAQSSEVKKPWAVQIGVFQNAEEAKQALTRVSRNIRTELRDALAYVEYAQREGQAFHRARLKNLTEDTAHAVCKKLHSLRQDCFVTKVN